MLENKFSIKRLLKPTDKDYTDALRIYIDTTPADIRTSSNEITALITNRDKHSPFEILAFALSLNGQVIGFAMMSYIKKQRIIIFDYLALDDNFRLNAVFFVFINLLNNYISSNSYEVAYTAIEVSNKNDGSDVDKESLLFKKLICMEGFGIIDAPYFTPPLGVDNHESNFKSYLYIKSNDVIKSLSKETFTSIVSAIYYEYYFPWYKKFLSESELEVYKINIDQIYNNIIASISPHVSFNIMYNDCPMISGSGLKTYGNLPSLSKKQYRKYPLIVIIVILSPIAILWIYNATLKFLEIPLSAANSTIGSIFGALLATVTAIYISKKKL